MIELRPYQKPIADKVFNYMSKHKGKHPLVALPTGSGKTFVIADIVEKVLTKWPEVKILVLSHVKEILEQNYNSISQYIKERGHNIDKIGINSSGLGKREVKPITIAGIQSIYKNIIFHDYKFIIVDECHTIPLNENGMYRSFFQMLNNPRYLGLTATPFRLGGGYIFGEDENKLFDDLIVDLTTGENFVKLIDDGYLSTLKAYGTETKMDPTNARTSAGDFNLSDLSIFFDRKQITENIVKSTIEFAKKIESKKWLIFAIDIQHAEHIAEILLQNNISANVVHSKMEMNRDEIIKDFRNGKYKAIVNVNVLTTGFDVPDIDLIVLARPTKSPVLHVQTLGRGMRISKGKEFCAVLDFAGNISRLGPINDITPYKKRKGEKGDPIMKECPKCLALTYPAVRICPECGHKFEFKTNLTLDAKSVNAISDDTPQWVPVDNVEYKIHRKNNSPDSLKVTYFSGLLTYSEWICPEHKGYSSHRAKIWAQNRGIPEADTTHEMFWKKDEIKIPTEIKVKKRGKFIDILAYKFD